MSVPPSQSQSRLADLNDFFQALRANDVPVGPGDIARLQQLFRLEPNLDRAGLHQLLSAVLVTTPTHREVFDALFNIWCPDEETDWPQEAPLESQPNQTPGTRHQPSTPSDPEPLADVEADVTSTNSLNRRRLVGLLLGTVLGCLLAWWYWPRPLTLSSPPPETPSQVQLTPSTQDSPDDLPAIPVEHVWLWSATATPETVHHPWQLGPVELSALGLIALALAGTAGWRYWRQVRPILPIARRNIGHSWQPLPARSRDDSALISARERQQLVWNIDHFVSEDPTHRLDLSATVDATARAGGFIEMRFTPAVYDRDIWFWLDRQLDQTTPRTAIAQLRATLAAAGLEAQQGLLAESTKYEAQQRQLNLLKTKWLFCPLDTPQT